MFLIHFLVGLIVCQSGGPAVCFVPTGKRCVSVCVCVWKPPTKDTVNNNKNAVKS